MSAAAERQRPPSVDTLARSLVASGLPHPILVDIARAAIEADDVESAPHRAEVFRRTLLSPVINATGVLLHTNLGRAPLRHHQEAAAQSVEFDLATGARGSRQRAVGQLLARLCGTESAIVVNNNAAAVMLVLAALVWLPGMVRGNRYRPARGWTAAPLWFGGPPDPAAAVESAQVGQVTRGEASGSW